MKPKRSWKQIFATMAPGFSCSEVARITRRKYGATRAAIHRHGYPFKDGRSENPRRFKVKWGAIAGMLSDTKLSNMDIVRWLLYERKTRISRERVRVVREEFLSQR